MTRFYHKLYSIELGAFTYHNQNSFFLPSHTCTCVRSLVNYATLNFFDWDFFQKWQTIAPKFGRHVIYEWALNNLRLFDLYWTIKITAVVVFRVDVVRESDDTLGIVTFVQLRVDALVVLLEVPLSSELLVAKLALNFFLNPAF